jgi:hypothetical protein
MSIRYIVRSIIVSCAVASILVLAHSSPMVAGSAQTPAVSEPQKSLTLDPKQFVGPVREAYTFAGKNPALLAQLRCYCGCDKAFGHQNLLDCYRSTHGATCEICTQEALLAKALSEQGSPVDQIRNAIRRNFAGDN